MSEYILGLNAIFHEPSACLIKDGKIITAIEEERLNRVKHSKFNNVLERLPILSIKYCLEEAGITIKDINSIGFSFNPNINCKFVSNNLLKNKMLGYQRTNTIKKIPQELSKLLSHDITSKFHWIDHHLSHASSAFFVSPFDDAAILSIDGIGEYCSTWMGFGEKNKIKKIKEISYPNSIGFLWEIICEYLGYSKYDSCKIMGLTSFGNPEKYQKQFEKIIKIKQSEFLTEEEIIKSYAIPATIPFKFIKFRKIQKILGKKRKPFEEITEKHYNIASTLQKNTQDAVLNLCRFLRKETNSDNLTLAGGVALNCVTNQLIAEESGFKDIFIQPAANDAGTAIGAAFYIWNQIENNNRSFVLSNPFLGPEFSKDEIKKTLEKSGLKFSYHKNIGKVTAEKLSQGNIIGWFQGKMEFGPRALGHRTVLADPRNKKIIKRLNTEIKKREWFRPYAPAVLKDKYHDYFEIKKELKPYQFMLFAVKAKQAEKIPAVVHVDNTSRVQLVDKKINHKFYEIITEFEKITGVPVVLNTSFNRRGEPIVCSPSDAIDMFKNTGMDYLTMDNFLVDKNQQK